MSHLYTRTGDKGMTSLVGGQRVSKTHIRLEAYGTIDELNSNLGLLLTYLSHDEDRAIIISIQNLLFSIGSMLATDTSQRDIRPGRYVTEDDIWCIEQAIDAAEERLPAWKGFILPGGTRAAAVAHVCRTVCRRAERAIHALAAVSEVDTLLMAYVNRLSDYFFILARKINLLEGVNENIWQKRNNESK